MKRRIKSLSLLVCFLLIGFNAQAAFVPGFEGKESKMSTLLEAAETDRDALRLSRPAGKNALEKYRRILQMDSGNRDALKGCVWILGRYGKLVKEARSNAEFSGLPELCHGIRRTIHQIAVAFSDRKQLDEFFDELEQSGFMENPLLADPGFCLNDDPKLFELLLENGKIDLAREELESFSAYTLSWSRSPALYEVYGRLSPEKIEEGIAQLEEKLRNAATGRSEKTTACGSSQVRIQGLQGSWIQNAETGQLFVIRGEAVIKPAEECSVIKVRGVIYDGEGKPVLQQTAYAGHAMTPAELSESSFAVIQRNMSSLSGGSTAPANPGQAVPFTIVFRDLPKGISEFLVEVAEPRAS